MSAPNKDLITVPDHELVLIHYSTGTSKAKSIYMAYSNEDLYRRGISYPFWDEETPDPMSIIGPGDIVFVALPYETTSIGLLVHRNMQHARGACVVPLGKGGFYSSPGKSLEIMKDIQGSHLYTSPYYALWLGEICEAELGIAPKDLGLKSIWVAGELCVPQLSKRIQEIWQVEVFNDYGMLEAARVGIECSEHNGFHVADRHVRATIFEDQGEEAEVSSGELVLDVFWRRALPLFKYRTGDHVTIDRRACGCGRSEPRLIVHGRISDAISLVEGKIFLSEIEEYLLSIPDIEHWFKLKLNEDGVLNVQLATRSFHEVGSAKVAIESDFAAKFGIECTITEKSTDQTYNMDKFSRWLQDGAKTK